MTAERARPLDGSAAAAAFPLGGLGTGNVSLGARGELRDWEPMHHPDTGRSLPFTFFAMRVASAGGTPVTRVLQSKLQPPHQFDQGYAAATVAGLPRFRDSILRAEYPIATVDFVDDTVPVAVSLTAFTPLVPLDVDASSIPGAVLRYTVANPSAQPVVVTVTGSLSNPVGMRRDTDYHSPSFDGRPRIDWRDDGRVRGLHCTSDLPEDHLGFGTASLVTDDTAVTAKPQWLVGFWNDGAQRFWDDLVDDGLLAPEERFSLDTDPGGFLAMERKSSLTDGELEDRLTRLRTGSLAITHELQPGEQRDFEFVLSWHFPNRPRGWRGSVIDMDAHPGEVVRNYYATLFRDSWAAACSLVTRLSDLEALTRAFVDDLYGGSLPAAIAESAGANLATLRSSTCFVLEDGTFAAWEGSFDRAGSCEGTCTHVWNYAQSAAFLFPGLERSARRIEFGLETDEDGLMQFRTNRLFDGPSWTMLPAVDGQLGTIVRLCREWTFSGDDRFLAELWPHARRALEFALRYWDTDGDLVLDGQQHTTYDIEFEGPDPLGNVLLLAALHAARRMAIGLGDTASADRYRRFAAEAAPRIDALLFNGRYYEQKTPPGDDHRYQYGSGVLSDQLFGQFLAHVAGLGHLLPRQHVRSALAAVHRHNFRPSLEAHVSVQRTYALNDEAGLVMCSWPDGGRPAIPFIYSDEVWTGVEHQVAAHLIYEGMIHEGLEIVEAVRRRHDGWRRNPWNEAECGNHYARSLASWGPLLAWSGQHYDAPAASLAFAPAGDGRFEGFFSAGAGWGRAVIDAAAVELHLRAGVLDLRRLTVDGQDVPLPDDILSVRPGSPVRLAR